MIFVDNESTTCLLYTSDAADDLLCVDLGGRRIIKKNNCRVFIRPSGTEPVLRILVEARNQKEVDSLSTKITTELSTKIYKISKTF